ncbi:MAG TPA: glycosyltransferase family 87 protein [Pseudolabrys sp.]|nr:glycosyltransferase family 87 protein [Pseudolabrys sp.]
MHADRRWRVINVAVFFGLAFYCVYYLTAFRFGTLFTDESRLVDFLQWHYFPPLILHHLEYPSVAFDQWTLPFPYLPSAVAMFMPLSALPRAVAFGLWHVLQAASLMIVLQASIKLGGIARLPARYLIGLAAVLATGNPLGWDFRTHNNNVIYLAMIMAALISRQVWLSAILIGLSANLKLYSGPLVAVFLWRREYRLAIAVTVAGLAIAIVLPILVFGFSGFIALLVGWVGQVNFHPPPGRPAVLPPDSFLLSAATVLGVEAASRSATTLLHFCQAVWLAVLAAYFIMATRVGAAAPDSRARLADVCVILLAPLPFSHYFAPYHAVPLLPAYVLLLAAAANESEPLRLRVIAGGAIALAQLMLYANPNWQFRGAVYFITFVAVTVALGVLRRAYSQRTQEAASCPSPSTASRTATR